MQKLFKINSSLSSYEVTAGHGILQQIINSFDNLIIVYDIRLDEYLTKFNLPKIAIEATEDSKDLDNISKVILQLKTLKVTKDYQILSIGGGVIQDISCFVASIYMRGINWLYFPTTLLGMVDSCIGGKSSINASGIKNIIGNFYPPQSIYIDTLFLNTLNSMQYKAGLCEAVKICFAALDGNSFTDYLRLTANSQNINMLDVISLTLKTKKWFIEQDEFDKKERQLLNFGHTFGHAIEAATHYKIPHGIAVGLGMIWACNLSKNIYSHISSNGQARIDNLMKYLTLLLIECPDLDLALIYDNLDLLLEKFELDKKHNANSYMCIIPNAEGYLEKKALPKNSNTLIELKNSFNFDCLINKTLVI